LKRAINSRVRSPRQDYNGPTNRQADQLQWGNVSFSHNIIIIASLEPACKDKVVLVPRGSLLKALLML
jgi:hypothetical protein